MSLEVITHLPNTQARPTPLLFVHGAWHGAWCWDVHFLAYFAQHGYSVHALSLRGHGSSASDKPIRWLRAADYLADIAEVVSSLERPPVLVGHSLGGYLVQKYLESHDAPAGVLVASLPSRGALPFFLRFAPHHPLAFLKAHVTLDGYPFVETLRLTHESFFSSDMPEGQLKTYFQNIQTESLLVGYDTALFHLPRPARVKSPMLVLGAANDAVFTPGEVEATARAYRTQATIFPDMAHDMMLEAGWQTVADHIIGWLQARGL